MADSDQHKNVAFYLRKIKQRDAATWEKDDLLDVIYWYRQVLGIVFGLLWGFGAITGFLGFMSAVILSCLLTMATYKSVLGIDEEDYGGHGEFLQEGLPGWVGSFLITWTLTYTAL
ncbi:Rab5-interacting protein-domain-containing protein, partial [Scenedesmus sp. NREL 46B-D3]